MPKPMIKRMNGTLPSLYIPYPQCGHCGEDVQIEDVVAYCDRCRLRWATIGEDEVATPDEDRFDDTETRCGVVIDRRPHTPHYDSKCRRYVPGPFLPCILPSGHETDHLCPYDVEITPA